MPYQVVGGMRFYERNEIKDALAYLRLLVNPHDDVSLQRVLNTPKRGSATPRVAAVESFAPTEGIPFARGCSAVPTRSPALARGRSGAVVGFRRR